ncbi:MAG TPA: hypothetical protein VHY91_03345 [Pirellulales bacterium]|jgi:hypothetical protein|nr:hypothetical protein [Pirellulales bacterium]
MALAIQAWSAERLPGGIEVPVLRLALATLVCCAPLATAPVLAAAADPVAVDVARLDVDQVKHVDIVSQLSSADGRELSVVLKPKTGQFSVDFDLVGRDFQRVRIYVLGAKQGNAARYFTDVNRKVYIDLTRLAGVDLFRSGDTFVIDFTTPTVALILPPEGRLLFRDLSFEPDAKAKRKAQP